MNYAILNQYDIKFEKINGRKQTNSINNELLERYIYIFKNLSNVDKFLQEIDKAKNGQITDAESFLYGSNPPIMDYGADDGGTYINADISPNSITISESDIINDSITIPLDDWREILLSWKEFLQS